LKNSTHNRVRLDLKKHNLGHLESKRTIDLTDDEIEQLMDAAAADDIALSLGIPWSRVNIRRALDEGKCMNCGRCCNPNPNRPDSPGVEVFEAELDAISAASHISREKLLKMTTKGADAVESVPNPREPTRWLPLPCPFNNQEKHRCEIHQSNPVVCRLYPFSMAGDILAVHVDCEYGKDIFRNMIKELRQKSKDPLFRADMPNPNKPKTTDFSK
jgi:Fe-S-cluster containining protein